MTFFSASRLPLLETGLPDPHVRVNSFFDTS